MNKMETIGIQWYPGHMTKTRRMMEEDLKLVDAVCELLDARIPISSRNPDIDILCDSKPRMVVLNRADLADPEITAKWISYFKKKGITAIATDCKSRKGVERFVPAVREILKEKLERYAQKGQTGRPLKIMIVGIPNVGKSTFINQVSGQKRAKAENRPGVTRGKQWITVDNGLLLLDTPGILWPKFEDPMVGVRLAWSGAIKEDVLDRETLGCNLMTWMYREYKAAIMNRYGMNDLPEEPTGYELLQAAGKRRGFLLRGGEIDTERMSKVILDEYRAGKLGRLSFEIPEETND